MLAGIPYLTVPSIPAKPMILMLALVFPAAGLKAKESSALQELTELSDTVFQLTRQSQYEEAVQILPAKPMILSLLNRPQEKQAQASCKGSPFVSLRSLPLLLLKRMKRGTRLDLDEGP